MASRRTNKTSRRIATLAVFLVAAAGGGAAWAQAFPADNAWVALTCNGAPTFDARRDQPGYPDERDVVGDAVSPASLRAADGQFLYLRMRLDADPSAAGGLAPFAWGWELDTDGATSGYEVLLVADGTTDTVAVYRNTATTLPNDPADPSEVLVTGFPFATHGRVTTAAGSSFGGNPDYFLDVAVPWNTLDMVGVRTTTPVLAWVASSSRPDRLDGDFVCHDDAAGPPRLTSVPVDRTVLDPARLPPGVAGRALEGGPGPGCHVAAPRTLGGAAWPCALIALALAGLAVRRRRGRMGIGIALVAASLALPSLAQAQVEVRVVAPTITFAAPPHTVTVSPGVRVVEDYDHEVFYVGGWYWVRHGKRWYHAHDHQGGWVSARPPVALVKLKPGRYKHWKGRHHSHHPGKAGKKGGRHHGR